MDITAKRIQLRNVCEMAKEENPVAIAFLANSLSCKIYTWTELRGINFYLRKGGKMEAERIYDRQKSDADRYLQVSVHQNRETKLVRINWIDTLEEGFFLIGGTYSGNGYPFDGLSSVWMAILDPEVGFKELFNTCHLGLEDLIAVAKTKIKKEEESDEERVK